MNYKIDEIIDRRNTNSEKWSSKRLVKYFGRDDLLTFGVGDMDLKVNPEISKSLLDKVNENLFGYEYIPESAKDSIINWFELKHKWKIDEEDIYIDNSILSTISICIDLYTQKGDHIIIQPPVYYPFSNIILNNNRIIENNNLIFDGKKYRIDFDDLEKKASNPNTKLMIVCNPHNPVGRVWTEQELNTIAKICKENNVLIISDEAHSDLVYSPHKYTPFASISKDYSQNIITCLSPSKPFNIAGCSISATIIKDKELAKLYTNFKRRYHLEQTNIFSIAAFESSYKFGYNWIDEIMDYLQNNLLFIKKYLKENIPEIELIEPEGTYFVWLDFKKTGLYGRKLENFLTNKAKIALDPGYWYGIDGIYYSRINIACPIKLLEEGLHRLKKSFDQIKEQ